jgi:hypothetical protein
VPRAGMFARRLVWSSLGLEQRPNAVDVTGFRRSCHLTVDAITGTLVRIRAVAVGGLMVVVAVAVAVGAAAAAVVVVVMAAAAAAAAATAAAAAIKF